MIAGNGSQKGLSLALLCSRVARLCMAMVCHYGTLVMRWAAQHYAMESSSKSFLLLLPFSVQDAVKVAQQFMESNGSIQFNLIALCAGPPAD